ncbi:MAG TPA: Rdx family protein [Candidatus Saccharimonadales bacterium]|nr:Rdx family protein [Candidatus Saccharimonadales bacterium]
MSLKEEIDGKFGAVSKIRFGSPGALEVRLDGEMLFSAKTAKRMPAAGEILALIAARRASA